MGYDCPVSVDEHNYVKNFTQDPGPFGGVNISISLGLTKSAVNIFSQQTEKQ